ncbi:MAG: thrombospondin type 3 repeat-containing protein [Myxococcota bacterium]
MAFAARVTRLIERAVVCSLAMMLGGVPALAQDTDGDGVPDAVDNCVYVPNGPNELSNQVNDGLPDPFGNACDTDYDNSGTTANVDSLTIASGFAEDGANPALYLDVDADGDGLISSNDQATFFYYFSRPAAPNDPGQPVGFDANDLLVEIVELEVDAGAMYGNSVVLPVGGVLTVGARLVVPETSLIATIGLSAFGYDAGRLGFLDGVAVPDVLSVICLEGSPGLGLGGITNQLDPSAGSNDLRMLVESPTRPTGPSDPGGAPRVRLLRGWTFAGAASQPADPQPERGLDGICANGDPQFRLRFEGLSDGLTEIEIGTGADLADVAANFAGQRFLTENAVVRVAVPEPRGVAGAALSLASISLGWLSRRRRR